LKQWKALNMATISEKIEKAALELSQARARFNLAQRNFDVLLGQVPVSNKGDKPQSQQNEEGQASVDAGEPQTRADQLIALLNSNPRKSWTYAEALPRMTGMNMPALRVLVFQLKKRGAISPAGYGMFKATDR
jgi:hypothetical protein